jgi:hypothetical protein
MDPREARERSEPAKRRASERVGESEGRSPSDKVDELRRQLRSLGYLDAGVDRFVLGPARERRGPAASAARLALRVGLLGGLLLGPAAAIGVGARLPGLVSSVRDAAVIAVYLALVFFVAVSVLSFVVSLSLATVARTRGDRFTRRAALASRAAGWIIAAACLVYLTLWWRNTNAGFGWSAPLWTSFALLVAVAISLLLGHAQRIATLAVLAAAAGATAQLPPVDLRSWRAVLGGGALAFTGAAVLLVLGAPASDTAASTDRPPLTVQFGRSVRLLAVDGFDPAIYDQLEDTLPNLKIALGGRQLRLRAQDTSDPARAWTTIATGVAPDVHGVHAIETRRVAGVSGVLAPGSATARVMAAATDLVRLTSPSVASRQERNAKTMWEVAEESGLRTGVVNWWATWPAPPTGGIVVTDRAVLRLERGGALDGELAPPGIYEPLRARWADIRRRAQDVAAQTFPESTETATILRRSAELDATVVAIAQHLSDQLDFFVVYLPGLDIAQNALLGASAGTQAPSAVASRVDALRSYYPFLDRVLAPLVEPAEKRLLMMVTQPGRVQTSVGGLFAISGTLAATTDAPPESTPLDVAPTILWTLGLPISRELAGRAVTDLHDPPRPVDRYVPTYGRPSAIPVTREGKPLDQEMIDRLRSLGYVK